MAYNKTMGRFLLPVILIAGVSWSVLAYIVWKVPPEIGGLLINVNFIYFFVSGWLAITLTTSILLYFIGFLLEAEPRKRPVGFDETQEARRVFRESLRRGAIFATALLSLGLLKIYGLDNLLNSTFIILIALLIEVYFSSR